jgi:hypothetical protein
MFEIISRVLDFTANVLFLELKTVYQSCLEHRVLKEGNLSQEENSSLTILDSKTVSLRVLSINFQLFYRQRDCPLCR